MNYLTKVIPRYFRDGVADGEVIYFLHRGESGRKSTVLTQFQLEEFDSWDIIPEHARIGVEVGQMQSLFDDLYNAGYRPSERRFGAAPQDEARQQHIADLRTTADRLFELLGSKRK